INQKLNESNLRRCNEEVSKKKPSNGRNTIIVYFDKVPTPMTSPKRVHSILPDSSPSALCASTSAHVQQHTYGASIVISNEPTASTGNVRPMPTIPSARCGRSYTRNVST